jgi:hypothetical protein
VGGAPLDKPSQRGHRATILQFGLIMQHYYRKTSRQVWRKPKGKSSH